MKIYFTLKSKHPVGISCISSVPLASYICMYLHDKHILRITTKFYFIIAILVTKAIFRKRNQENQVNRTLLSHFVDTTWTTLLRWISSTLQTCRCLVETAKGCLSQLSTTRSFSHFLALVFRQQINSVAKDFQRSQRYIIFSWISNTSNSMRFEVDQTK